MGGCICAHGSARKVVLFVFVRRAHADASKKTRKVKRVCVFELKMISKN